MSPVGLGTKNVLAGASSNLLDQSESVNRSSVDVAEASDSSETQRNGTHAVGSRYQKTG
jgi:hypothetical protein